MVQEIMGKDVSLSVKMHFSVSGHVTLGVVRWRHELNHTYPQYILSKFGPMQAYVRLVTANWFFPSNGLKRYFNGPLSFQHKGGHNKFQFLCDVKLHIAITHSIILFVGLSYFL